MAGRNNAWRGWLSVGAFGMWYYCLVLFISSWCGRLVLGCWVLLLVYWGTATGCCNKCKVVVCKLVW